MEPSFNAPKSSVILALQTVLTMRVPETLHLTVLGRGSRLRDEPAEKFSGAAMAAIGQKGLPVIVWNIRFYAGITLCWLYFCKRKGR